jgi:hypothetical protein
VVRSIFHPSNADHVLEIKIPAFDGEDFIAGNYEISGLFSVKSVYRLALEIQARGEDAGQSTSWLDRDIWDIIWKAKVPPKVRVFGWKLATDTLGVQALQHHWHMDHLPTCSICGMEPETNHHAMVNCTNARALRHRLKDAWSLPDDHAL